MTDTVPPAVRLPCVDLFSGAGGLSLGLTAAGFDVLAAVELDRDSAETYRQHHPRTDLLECDITTAAFEAWRGKVALVAGGPPCQPFSVGGKRLANQDERDCLPDFMRALEEIQPLAFLIENVPGLLASTRLSYFASYLRELRRLGYSISSAVLNAAEYGVPQNRRRLFIVGIRGAPFSFPEPTNGPGRAGAFVSVRSVVDPAHPLGEQNPAIVTYAQNPDLRPSPYDGHVFNGGGRPLDPDRPAHTVLASAGGNKTHFVDLCGIVPEYHAELVAGRPPRRGQVSGVRRLTVEESARLQTFPEQIVFRGKRSSRYHQVGNAVPVMLAEKLGRSLKAQLAALIGR